MGRIGYIIAAVLFLTGTAQAATVIGQPKFTAYSTARQAEINSKVTLAGTAGGQTINGGTAASETLTLKSTAHATKGKILFGASAYDEVNNRLGIGTASPNTKLDVQGSAVLGGTFKSWGSGFNVLQMGYGLSLLAGSASDISEFESNVYWNGSTYVYSNTGPASKMGFGAGQFDVATVPAGTAGNPAVMISKFNVANNGVVTVVNQIASSLATGTAPFAVTSTTKNTNLNADLWDGLHSTDVPNIKQNISLTAQVAAIGTTAITGTNTAGLYRVSYSLLDTTADLTAGTIMVNFTGTDEAGAFTMSSVALPLTALGRTQGTFFLRILGTGSVSYSTTLVGIIGASQYGLFISAEKIL